MSDGKDRTSPRPRLQDAARIPDKLKRALYVVGILTDSMGGGSGSPVIVGGMAVEFYTFGAYTTQDIDLVCPRRAEAVKSLEALGFSRTENRRHWYHEAYGLVIEIPDEKLAGDPARVTEVDIDGLRARVIGIEDLIVDRLRAYVHWKSESDGEWARRLMLIHRDEIDWGYLQSTAAREELKDALTGLDPRSSSS